MAVRGVRGATTVTRNDRDEILEATKELLTKMVDVNNLDLDIYMTVLFGVLGYIFMKLKCEPAPLILAFVLGPLMEENLRRALLISRGDPTVFFTRPISLGFLIATVALLLILVVPTIRKKREEATAEPDPV